jgi:hypothetical protein
MRLVLMIILAAWTALLIAGEYHVAKSGNDGNPGSPDSPFLTIQAAAEVARAGDVVIVHEGVYRERVDPRHGGIHEQLRIVYQAAENARVVIKGSELLEHWEQVAGGVWKAQVDNTVFGSYNPYDDLVFGDWYNPQGMRHHTGELFFNGRALFEQNSLDGVMEPEVHEKAVYPERSLWTWYAEVDGQFTTFWANFQDKNPNRELVEMNVREACFYPSRPGINYITIRGFELSQAATQWAAPTAEQPGLIGTHWSRGWIIENNVISHSKSVGISLGKDRATGHNVWKNNPAKDGATAYNEVIFNALDAGWSREQIGSHLVRNNVHSCGQAGIVGSLGAVFSTIRGNHIYDIYTKRTYAGAEMAGIKIHAAIDMLIEKNRIHGSFIGIWLDWMAQGARVSRNLLYDNSHHDFFSEVNHGPLMVDHNLFLTTEGLSIQDASEGTAFVHNLFVGRWKNFNVAMRSTPYHRPHSTRVMAVRNIQGGDNRFFNNIFIRSGEEADEAHTDRAHQHIRVGYGLSGYDDAGYDSRSEGNIFYHGARPYKYEQNSLERPGYMPVVRVEERGEEVYLIMEVDSAPSDASSMLVTSEELGFAVVPEAVFEHRDGTAYRLDRDFLNEPRMNGQAVAGPFRFLKSGINEYSVW